MKIAFSVLLILCLALGGCAGASLAVLIDGIAIAAQLAVPFVGPYGGFVAAAATAAAESATELTTQDPASVQTQKILGYLNPVVAAYPDLTNAGAMTKAVIVAVELAVSQVIALIQGSITKPALMARKGIVAGSPMPLTKNDAAAIADTLEKSSATLKALGR
jgi:hypothetical protein